jgi:hypothetical protein
MSHVSQSDDPIQMIAFSGQTTGLVGFGEDETRMDNLAVGGHVDIGSTMGEKDSQRGQGNCLHLQALNFGRPS